MAKTNRKPGTNSGDDRTSSAGRSRRTASLSGPDKSVSFTKTSISAKADKVSSPTHDEIAGRAKEIWRQKGCPAGQDDANWFEAENQLKRELVASKA